ncbi:MAG: ribonuclease P protein component [Candidatus Dormibacteria bacterium]
MRTRLGGRRRFAVVRAARTRASVGTLRVHVAANGLDVPRVGFVIRDVRHAVMRNRLRRRLRAALRPRLRELVGLDVVITGLPPAASAPFAELEADLGRCVTALMVRPGPRHGHSADGAASGGRRSPAS